jgi:Uma2 family endonuclease
VVVQERYYTADDLMELSRRPENEGKRFELSEGIVIEMSPAGGKHGGIAGHWFGYVWTEVTKYDLGYVTAAETGYVLFKNPSGKDTVRAPDVGFVAKARLPDGLPDGYVPLAPDLAVEVVSPNDEAEEIQSKLNDYLTYGTRMVVFTYPKTKTVNVYSQDSIRILHLDDTFDGGDILPDFTLPLKAVFKG